MSFSQVTFECPSKKEFSTLADRLEKHVQGRQYAVTETEADAASRSVLCRWRLPVGYKSVQSWFGTALDGCDVEWSIRCVAATTGDANVTAGEPAPGGTPDKQVVPEGSSVTSSASSLAPGVSAAAAAVPPVAPETANVSALAAPTSPKRPAPAKTEAPAATATTTPTVPSLAEEKNAPVAGEMPAKRRCMPASSRAGNLSYTWLPLKAFELDRGAEVDPNAKPKFTKLEEIGAGTFGSTQRAIEQSTNRVVVLKRLRGSASEGKHKDNLDTTWEFHHEVCLLSRLVHENIVQLLDVMVRPYTLVLADAGLAGLTSRSM
jgi:hypothetical protein